MGITQKKKQKKNKTDTNTCLAIQVRSVTDIQTNNNKEPTQILVYNTNKVSNRHTNNKQPTQILVKVSSRHTNKQQLYYFQNISSIIFFLDISYFFILYDNICHKT